MGQQLQLGVTRGSVTFALMTIHTVRAYDLE